MSARINLRFEDWEAEKMRDPEFRAAAEELEPAYQITRRLLQLQHRQFLEELKALEYECIEASIRGEMR